jgi:dTMP kinase
VTGQRTAIRRRGFFVSFEGIEGSGKTTQARILSERLAFQGQRVVQVREPGGTRLGEALRGLLLAHAEEGIDPRSELCLYLAARAQLVAHVVEPALRDGAVVIADRFGDASVAYQGGGRELGPARVRGLVRFITGGLLPDRTYLLDVAPETSLDRVHERGAPDRLEAEGLAFHRRVRAAYRAIARAEPGRVLVLAGREPVEKLAERIQRDLASRIQPVAGRRPVRGARRTP